MPEPSNSLATGDEPGNYYQFINFWQTSEERQAKYWLAISLGANPSWARSMRDWRLSKIERFFGLDPSNYKNRKAHDKQLNTLCLLPL